MASLAYSGISVSPYEFYSEGKNYQDEKGLNKKLKKIFEKEGKQFLEPQDILKKIDDVFKIARYTPLYHKFCGVEKGIFLNQ